MMIKIYHLVLYCIAGQLFLSAFCPDFLLIVNLGMFPLISTSEFFSNNELTVILNIICLSNVKHIVITDKNKTVKTFKSVVIIYISMEDLFFTFMYIHDVNSKQNVTMLFRIILDTIYLLKESERANYGGNVCIHPYLI